MTPKPPGTETQMPQPSSTPSSTLLPSGTLTGTPETTANVTPTPLPRDAVAASDPSAIMKATLDYVLAAGEVDPSLIRRMGESGDATFIPVLLDLLFFRRAVPPELTSEITKALTVLTDTDSGQYVWPDWFEWLGRHSEVRAPPGYAGWKGQLLSVIDKDFPLFFYDGVKARIRLEEIAWGGVRKDGIPDLIDPPAVTPDEATYLNPDDRVFGVSINGEHRAYPFRVMNPHEMANDVVGGEPIALAY